MSEPFIGEIRLFGCNFAPRGWAFCHGQLISISQNTALFSLLGTIYGGDGRTIFGLPNCKNRAVIGAGQAPGLNDYNIGVAAGIENVTLTINEMPQHTHSFAAGSNPNSAITTVSGNYLGSLFYGTTSSGTQMNPSTIDNGGGGMPHTNVQPVMQMNYCISLQGLYPSRD